MMSGREIEVNSTTGGDDLGVQKKTRPTIGVFLGQLEERYQSLVWPGMADTAEELDLNLIFFPGGPLDIPDDAYNYMLSRNAIYDLARPENLDGLVLFSGTLAGFVEIERYYQFCDRFKSLPMVSLSLPVDGASNILMDNKNGMKAVVAHLIEVHDCQQIAFIRGPIGHLEADKRFQAYVEVLESHNIPLDPKLILHAHFTATSSRDTIREFLDQPDIQFDAIVSANDRMAVGAIEVLQERGIKIPDDVAIVGFDDIEESRYTLAPLTTVKQPFYEQSKNAIEVIHQHLMGDSLPQNIILPAKLIVRQSCGCTLAQEILQQNLVPHEAVLPSRSELKDQRAEIVNKIIESGQLFETDQRVTIETHWVEILFDAFTDELQGGGAGKFLAVLEDLLNLALNKSGIIAGWQEMNLTLRNQVNPYFTEPESQKLVDDLWQNARTMIGEFAVRAQAYHRYQTILRTLQISETSQSLLTTFNFDQLIAIIHQDLPELEIRSCFLALYEGEPGKPSDQARLVLAFEGEDRLDLGSEGLVYPAHEYLPKELPLQNRRKTWVLSPLLFRSDQFGFIIMEIGPRDGMVYETIRRYISSALKGTLLLQERIKAEEELKEYHALLEERVSERTRELHETNIQLQREIADRNQAQEEIRQLNEELEQRVIQRTALLETTNQELESFSYSVSHDLRTPLRAIIGYSSILQEDFIDQIPPEALKHLSRINQNAHHMNQLVLDLLTFSRLGRQELIKYPVDCAALARQVFDDLSPEWTDRQVEIDISEVPSCLADPALLKQVLINLFSNAIKFTRIRETAQIRFFSEQEENKIIYIIKDNGAGFDPLLRDRLFGVFQRLHTLKEFEGTGVGLATAKRIITRHGGQIWAESEIDQGATFYFTLE